MSILHMAREAICNRGAPLRHIRASQGERGEPSGAPQCKRGASVKPIGRLNVKDGRLWYPYERPIP